jgi:hypothetical protein
MSGGEEDCIIILRSKNHTKTLWQVIKKEVGNNQKANPNISLEIDSISVSNPQYISHQFNSFFIENVDRMINVNKDQNHRCVSFSNITHNRNSMFLVPVTEDEVQKVTSKLKGKFSAGYDEIPDHGAQLLVIYNIHKQAKEDHTYFKRKINKYHIADFQLNPSYESWGMVFDENNVNEAFNIF